MRLILIPDDTSSGNSYSLSSMQVRLLAVVSLVLLGLLFAIASLSGIWAFSSSQLAATASANTDLTGSVITATAAESPQAFVGSPETITSATTPHAATPPALAKVVQRDQQVSLASDVTTDAKSLSDVGHVQTLNTEVAHPGERTFDQRTLPDRLNHAISKVIAVAKGGRDENQSATRTDPKVLSEIQQLRSQLSVQARQLALLRDGANSTLNELGVRVGSLQAHVTRLNALGHRLTQNAELTSGEFDFAAEPAVGGSASATQVQAQGSAAQDNSAATAPVPDIATSAHSLQNELQHLELQMRESDSQLAVLEVLLQGRRLKRQSQPVGWPAEAGWVSSNFGERQDPFTGVRSFHKGIDIAAGIGTSVQAAASGLVLFAGTQGDLGQVVEISHGSGYTTRYAHNSELLVNKGDFVVKGEQIAAMGSSGRSTGSHLHFEVLENGKAVNPLKYLESQ